MKAAVTQGREPSGLHLVPFTL